jgi:hypothetical protein
LTSHITGTAYGQLILPSTLPIILSALDQIQTREIQIKDQWVPSLPTHLREDQDLILKALKITLPKTLRQVA